MNNLQTLLDERYPETEISHIQRQAFMDGYNAAKEENDPIPVDQNSRSREEVENKVRLLRREGKKLEALKYFRESPYSVGGLKDDKDYCESL